MEFGLNVTMLVVVLIFILGALKGWKMGLVQEIVSMVSLVLLVLVLLLIGSGLQSYQDREYLQIVFIVIILLILGLATKIGTLISKLTKSIVELPFLSLVNSLGGLVVGIAEALFFIWVGMIVMQLFEYSAISQFFIAEVSENPLLTLLNNLNFLNDFFIK